MHLYNIKWCVEEVIEQQNRNIIASGETQQEAESPAELEQELNKILDMNYPEVHNIKYVYHVEISQIESKPATFWLRHDRITGDKVSEWVGPFDTFADATKAKYMRWPHLVVDYKGPQTKDDLKSTYTFEEAAKDQDRRD